LGGEQVIYQTASNMAGRLANSFKSAVVFAYGFLTLILYGLQAVKKGLFFKRPTEKEKLELQLGEWAYIAGILIAVD
jgi:hypothetical protein